MWVSLGCHGVEYGITHGECRAWYSMWGEWGHSTHVKMKRHHRLSLTRTTCTCHTHACAHTQARASDQVINNKVINNKVINNKVTNNKEINNKVGLCMHFRAIIMGHSGLNLSRDGRRHTCRPRRRTSVNVAKPQSATFEPSAISFYFGMTLAGIRLARIYTTPFSSIVDLSWHDVTAPACWMF